MEQLAYICVGAAVTQVLHDIPRYIGTGSGSTLSSVQPESRSLRRNKSKRQELSYDENVMELMQQQQREPKMGDGCRHVFLDVGSNIGVHGRMLLEPHLYASSSPKKNGQHTKNKKKFSSRQFIIDQFGPEESRTNTQYCIFAFEPNPAHIHRHQQLESAYSAMGWRYHFLHAGVGDERGELTFYHIGKGDKELERGFTTVKERCRRECRPENVQVYRLSDWIDSEIHDRIIPDEHVDSTSTNDNDEQQQEPRVVMKMDIEMGEWLVFPDLLSSGVLCRDVDALLGEFHLKQHMADYPIHFPQRANWTLNSYEEAEVLKNELFGIIERNPHCKTELIVGDDESFGNDGMPLPKPPESDFGTSPV